MRQTAPARHMLRLKPSTHAATSRRSSSAPCMVCRRTSCFRRATLRSRASGKSRRSSGVDAIACGSYRDRDPPHIRGTGYVVDCLEAALWAFHRSSTFRDGALRAVNLGDDADTTGAVYGQIAGAYYGATAIPQEWQRRLARLELLEDYAERLCRSR